MNAIASPPEAAIRDIPLCRLVLAPENVRKTPPNEAAEDQLRASIAAHGLLKNLVARLLFRRLCEDRSPGLFRAMGTWISHGVP